jgi:hypothetical protein
MVEWEPVGETEVLGGKHAPVTLCSAQFHTIRSNMGRHGGKPATNLLSYGTGGNLTEKLIVAQPLKGFPAHFETRRLTTVFTSLSHISTTSQMNLVHTLPFYFLKAHRNTVTCKCVTIDGVWISDLIYWPLTGSTTNNYSTIAISTLYSWLLHTLVFSDCHSLH